MVAVAGRGNPLLYSNKGSGRGGIAGIQPGWGSPAGPTTTTYYHMVGFDSVLGYTVSWRVTGAPDPTGAQYSTPANLVAATIRVAASWTI